MVKYETLESKIAIKPNILTKISLILLLFLNQQIILENKLYIYN